MICACRQAKEKIPVKTLIRRVCSFTSFVSYDENSDAVIMSGHQIRGRFVTAVVINSLENRTIFFLENDGVLDSPGGKVDLTDKKRGGFKTLEERAMFRELIEELGGKAWLFRILEQDLIIGQRSYLPLGGRYTGRWEGSIFIFDLAKPQKSLVNYNNILKIFNSLYLFQIEFGEISGNSQKEFSAQKISENNIVNAESLPLLCKSVANIIKMYNKKIKELAKINIKPRFADTIFMPFWYMNLLLRPQNAKKYIRYSLFDNKIVNIGSSKFRLKSSWNSIIRAPLGVYTFCKANKTSLCPLYLYVILTNKGLVDYFEIGR